MKAKALTLSALVLAAVAWAADRPEFVTKEATGEAAIVSGDASRAEKAAVDAALRNAVEQVAGVTLSSMTLTRDNTLVQDQILTNSAGYVRKYDVTNKKTEKNVVTVTVKAEIGTAQLDKDLLAVQAMIKQLGHPKLVIVIQEQTKQNVPETDKSTVTNTGVTSSVLSEIFKKDGWTIIDPNWAAGELTVGPGFTMTDAAAKKIGSMTKANYILYGRVSLQNMPAEFLGLQLKDQKLFPVTGEYDLQVFATDSGTQLVNVTGKLGTFADYKAMPVNQVWDTYERTAHELINRKKGEMVSQVRSAVLESLRSAGQNGNRVSMKVSGLGDLTTASDFSDAVKAIPVVREIHENGNFDNGTQEFDVILTGRTRDFALGLEKATFKKKKMKVKSQSENTVVVEVVSSR